MSDVSEIDTGIARDEALRRAREFLRQLRGGAVTPPDRELDDATVDVLHAACRLISMANGESLEGALEDSEAVFDFVSRSKWREPDFEERADVLCSCAFAAWRSAREVKAPSIAADWFARIRGFVSTDTVGVFQLEGSPLVEASVTPAGEAELARPETLLKICAVLRNEIDSTPLTVVDRASYLYHFIDERKVNVGRFDERDYFLGELALIAGVASRLLSRRTEARAWSDRAEVAFESTVNVAVEMLRVNYLRLALCLEERRFEEFFEQLPALADSFRRLGMNDEAVKCDILKGLAQMETGELDEAANTFRETLQDAHSLRNKDLVASSYVNLVHTYGTLGKSDEAMDCSRQAIPILKALNHRVALAQIQLGLGSLLRAKGQLRQAVEAYRSSQEEFANIGMKADVAATGLMIADLLLDLRRDDLALKEILQALPVIDELKMVSEGLAAVSLLHESIRQHKINRQALRDLHGYFEDLRS